MANRGEPPSRSLQVDRADHSGDTSEASVLFVTRKWPPAVGGMETYSLRLSEELAKLRPLKVMALPGRANGAPPGAVDLVRFGASTALRLLARRDPPAVVHIADMASWPLALPARVRRRRTRVVLSAHGTDVAFPRRGDGKGRLYGAYLRFGARALPDSVVVANSRATADLARSHGFSCVRVVPLGTDMKAPALVGRHNGDVIFAGRLVARKGCGWFVREVLPRLPDQIGMRVAGTPWDESEAHVLDHPRVQFLGPLPQSDLAQAYAEALCVVVPNLPVADRAFEGFGLVAVEAAAAGGLVLASKHDGLRESVIDGETGRHLPPGDAEAWAAAIREIASFSPDRRKEASHLAMQAVDRHFRWARVARETTEAYDISAVEKGVS